MKLKLQNMEYRGKKWDCVQDNNYARQTVNGLPISTLLIVTNLNKSKNEINNCNK